jgi:hypothetical protein
VLEDACHWREVRVREIVVPSTGARPVRADVSADVVGGGARREFAGLCRAKHAVVEASIVASRLTLLPIADVVEAIRRLDALVEKTGGPRERAAFEFVRSYIDERVAASLR